MSEIMTRLRLPGQTVFSGLLEWDRKTAEEMIAFARLYSSHLRAQADLIDAAPNGAFQIDIVRGSHVQHFVREVQKASDCSICGDLGFIPPAKRMGEVADCPECSNQPGDPA